MIQGKGKTENTYRAVNMDSSSSLKEFSVDRKKYYKRYVLEDRSTEEDNNSAATMGRIVETLLMEPEEFDNKFYLSGGTNVPTGKMLEFVNQLYKLTIENTDEFNTVLKSFTEIAKEAHASVFKVSFESVINKFVGSNAEIYFKELCKVKTNGLTIISQMELIIANKIVDRLKTNIATADIVNTVNSVRYSVYNQYQIEGYKINDLVLKSMLDKIIVDHNLQEITIYDLKCTWNVENFFEEYYLYRRAYIQAYLYYNAVVGLTEDPDNEWYGYSVNYPKFIVCDSSNYYSPLVFCTNQDDLDKAYNGFIYNRWTYPGVNKIIDDLKFALENDIWDISKENYENNGKVTFKY